MWFLFSRALSCQARAREQVSILLQEGVFSLLPCQRFLCKMWSGLHLKQTPFKCKIAIDRMKSDVEMVQPVFFFNGKGTDVGDF